MEFIGFEIKNFRSIGEKWVKITPLRKINIVVGKNNSGKSNVIKAIQKIKQIQFDSPTPTQGYNIPLDILDYHKREQQNNIEIKIIFDNSTIDKYGVQSIGEIFFTFIGNKDELSISDYFLLHQPYEILEYFFHEWGTPIPHKNNKEALKEAVLKSVGNFFPQFSQKIPDIRLVPQFRQIGKGEGDLHYSGENLIGNLKQWQHPEIGNEANRKKFSNIEQLVAKLIHLPNAKIEITDKNNEIIINDDGFRLPIDSYGTGVHEITILATAVTTLDQKICCIEEPEIHLHPGLQKEFIIYIANETTNTYIITTHSNAFIDLPIDMQLFHTRLKAKVTMVSSPIDTNDVSNILADLGYKPSDILQSNGIIWVEGPSDRIYIKKWIELISADKWVEGKDYLIMFYGGRLLSHLTLNEKYEVDNFIKLLKINRNAIVVMDSDRKKSGERVNKTKKRIKEECEKNGCIPWITNGREIENYLTDDLLSDVIQELTNETIDIVLPQFDKIEDVISKKLKSKNIDDIKYASNKVYFANLFVESLTQSHIQNPLRKELKKVEKEILKWNT